MTDHRHEGPGENGRGIPRDLPDQQAGEGEDPWEVAPDAPGERQPDVPDTDEAGTGRRGTPHSASADPEQPVPDEASG
ncbi:hypothetical protein GCM10027073_14950 [Streptomyces chlorus]|uniref:Uncharacterized protein n=1 Tax=Streptomyces chlorus TaxID=887452 RepID=A0ABW1DRT2_9ACTN